MLPGKEALVNIERMAKAQYQVYSDSADLGIEVTENEINGLRADCKTLKGIYSGTNYFPAGPEYAGVKDIIIPLEACDHMGRETEVYRCIVIDVLVSKQFKNVAFIEINSKVLSSNKIPFLNKETV